MKKDGIADDVPIMIAGYKLLGQIDSKILDSINPQVGKQLQRIGPSHIQIGHVVRLVEKRAGFLPGPLLIPPVAELGTYHRKGIRSDLRIPQHLDRIAGSLQQFLQITSTHRGWSLLLLAKLSGGGTRRVPRS